MPAANHAIKAQQVLQECGKHLQDAKNTESWLQKSFCCFWSNFYTCIPWSEVCVLSILYTTLYSNHKGKSMCYMWACRCALGLQMQVKGKEVKDDTVQQKELAVYFSHGNLQKFHLRLALLNTMGVCYKGGSFSTAANFAWWLLESEPLQTIQQGYNKFCRHARGSCRMPKNWIITFNSESLLLAVQQLLHLYPMVSQKDVSCPYCTACFVPVRRGNLCPICELAIVGFNASGCWMCIFISRNVITQA